MQTNTIKWLPPSLSIALLLASVWVYAGQATSELQAREPQPKELKELKAAKTYTVTSAPTDLLHLPPPVLPDLSGYTAEAVNAKIQTHPAGQVQIERMLQQDTLKEFTGGDGRLREWLSRQREMPKAVFIQGGYVTPRDLAKALPKKYFEEVEPGVFVARLPIVVQQGATLHIDKEVKDLRMSQERGAFLINDGKFFLTGSRLTAWNETKGEPAWFAKEGEFRPFYNAWGSTETYMVDSVVTSLGYAASKSYGVSLSQYSPSAKERMKRSHPNGWLLNTTFDDLWYGFYCYEAEDVVIKGNIYRNNILYGIDPHDRSRRLIIADNEAYGTKKKHGIIVSREVNDSWIFNNRSHDNKLSGIVIDRSSVNNLVAYNEVYRNHSDGITLYESSDNLLWGNHAFENERHGIRLRNSLNIRLYENIAAGNGLTGIYGHIKDLSNTDRDTDLDPFDTKVSMIVVGGKLIGNHSYPISIDSPLSVELYRVELLAPTKSSGINFSGILGEKQEEILDLMVRRQQAVLIDPVDTQAGLQN